MVEFKLPDIGEGLHEAEIVRWLVRVGEAVRQDQPMVEVQTDKALTEIGAPVAGTVAEICVPEGKLVPVGTVLVRIQPAGAAAPPAAEAAPAAAPAAGAGAAPPAGGLAAPSVRKAARELGIDLRLVQGSGPAGRITLADLQRHQQQAAAALAPAARLAAPDAAPVDPAPAAPAPALAAGGEESVPLQGLRRRIAERMTQSWRSIPHVTSFAEADATALSSLRGRLHPEAERRGARLTYLPFVIKAVTTALKEHPYLNATFDEAGGRIILKRYYHVGIAMAIPEGLVVPVIRDADRKSIFQLAAELQGLAERARQRTLTQAELTGSTFTISNFGAFGGSVGTPIINPPEVAVLGIGQVAQRPAVVDGQVVARATLPLSLSFDHRVVDGEGAGRFLNRLVHLLAEPDLMFLELI